MRNRAIDAWRRAAARPVEVEAVDEGSSQLSGAAGAEAAVDDRALVLSLIAELPMAQRQAVFLAYFGDMTHAEIAQLADTPLGTIKGRIRLGVEKLRDGVEAAETGDPDRPGRSVTAPGARLACHTRARAPSPQARSRRTARDGRARAERRRQSLGRPLHHARRPRSRREAHPCRFTTTQLKNAQQQITGDVDAYAKGIRPAIKRELKRWQDGKCKNKRGYAKLKIVKVSPVGEPGSESITIKNIGRKAANLRNYSLRDRDDHVLRLRKTKLKAGATLRVMTACRSGASKPGRKGSRYYVCKSVAVWDDAGDLVELLGPGGGLISKKQYGTSPA